MCIKTTVSSVFVDRSWRLYLILFLFYYCFRWVFFKTIKLKMTKTVKVPDHIFKSLNLKRPASNTDIILQAVWLGLRSFHSEHVQIWCLLVNSWLLRNISWHNNCCMNMKWTSSRKLVFVPKKSRLCELLEICSYMERRLWFVFDSEEER